MAKTATINSRIEPALKENAEKVFRQLGLSTSEAITLFYKQVTLQKGLPFNVRLPTDETLEAMQEADTGKLAVYDSLADLKDEWEDL